MEDRDDCKSIWDTNVENTTTADAMQRAPKRSYLNEEAIQAVYPNLPTYPAIPPKKGAIQSKSLAKAMALQITRTGSRERTLEDTVPSTDITDMNQGEQPVLKSYTGHSVNHGLTEPVPEMNMEGGPEDESFLRGRANISLTEEELAEVDAEQGGDSVDA